MSDSFLVVATGWGWCGLRCSPAGLRRSTLPYPSREQAVGAVGRDARWGEGERLLEQVAEELRRYFEGQATEFGVELDLAGLGDFSRRVLWACGQVRYGSTYSYGMLAAEVGVPRAARAVGQVLHRNPLALVVPCHRIVGADGRLVGFGGGLELKRRLLALEAGEAVPAAAAGVTASATAGRQ